MRTSTHVFQKISSYGRDYIRTPGPRKPPAPLISSSTTSMTMGHPQKIGNAKFWSQTLKMKETPRTAIATSPTVTKENEGGGRRSKVAMKAGNLRRGKNIAKTPVALSDAWATATTQAQRISVATSRGRKGHHNKLIDGRLAESQLVDAWGADIAGGAAARCELSRKHDDDKISLPHWIRRPPSRARGETTLRANV